MHVREAKVEGLLLQHLASLSEIDGAPAGDVHALERDGQELANVRFVIYDEGQRPRHLGDPLLALGVREADPEATALGAILMQAQRGLVALA